jgi:hypothetical protein
MVLQDNAAQYMSGVSSSKSVGWMVSNGDNTLKSQAEPEEPSLCIRQLQKLFENAHRFSESRLDWLVKWTGADVFDAYHSETVANFSARLHFLKKVWSDVNFRPFDTIESSVHYLHLQSNQHFLIRLSTTVPGGITLTFRKDVGSKEIVHTRFAVNNLGNITDSHGHQHSTVASFANWFSAHKYNQANTNKTIPLAGYIQADQLRL